MEENNITLKIKYTVESSVDSQTILDYIKNYNNVLRFTYNRLVDGNYTQKEITSLQNSMNNIFIDSWLRQSAYYESKAMLSSIDELNKTLEDDKKIDKRSIIFGSKDNFIDRCKGVKNREEFLHERNHGLYSVGESTKNGNRKFRIQSNSCIIFQPNRKTNVTLNLQSVSKKWKKYIDSLIVLQNNKVIPITYRLDLEYIHVTFDLNAIEEIKPYKYKKNRVLAVDMNPNYVGYSVVDWKSETSYNVIDSGMFSMKPLNDLQNSSHYSSDDKKSKYFNDKRRFEIVEIAHRLVKLCKHFKCECLALEGLQMFAKDNKKGRRFNRQVNNQWCRDLFVKQITKITKLHQIKLFEVRPEYSSFIGNLLYRKENLPDPVLSSIEIGRRAIEFNLQYCLRIKDIKYNIIYPDLKPVKTTVEKSLEELGYCEQFNDWKELYSSIKNSKQRYRVLLDELPQSRVFSIKYKRRKEILYTFV